MKTPKIDASRRSFLAAAGVAAVAVTIPAHASAAVCKSWREAGAEQVQALRESYLAEIERLAETLRPRFESGELYSFRENDSDGQCRVEAACAAHLGLGSSPEEWKAMDAGPARLIIAASPHADSTGYGAEYACDHARESAAWDVLALARERRWYTPTQDECGDPALSEVES